MASLSAAVPRAPFGPKAVGIWLLVVAALIAAMVTVGGLTRLTGSGLSITEWHPVTGVVPPFSEQSWSDEFAKYRQIPQYRLEHPGMHLADFKEIYWWEWSHRLLGRLLGAAFLLPALFFIAMGTIPRGDYLRMLGLFALGGLQGFVGWWMVMSGLETRVSVSQYRLAIHLGVAIILFGAILWAALDYFAKVSLPPLWGKVARDVSRVTEGGNAARVPPSASRASTLSTFPHKGGRKKSLAFWSLAFVALVYVQMLLGALVAGLHAGLIYNTWPLMNGHVFPEQPFFNHPWWSNFGEDAGLAQFDHRIGAYVVGLSAIALWWGSRQSGVARLSGNVLLGIVAVQIILGIATLLSQAPLALAAPHQATAVALFAAAVWYAHTMRTVATPLPAPGPNPR